MVAIGKSNDNAGGKKNWFKLKEGDNVFRILPPMFSCAEKGVWNRFYSVVYGYQNSKNKLRPFADCRVTNWQTKMVEVESPAYLRTKQIEAHQAQIVEAFKAGQATQDQVKEIAAVKKRYNIDSKYFMNAMDLQGNIGILKVPSKLMNQIKAEIKKLTDMGIDPRSVENGRFFVISRVGMDKTTTYSIKVYQENQTVQTNEGPRIFPVEKVSVLTEGILNRLDTEATDLNKLYVKLTPEQIQDIVNRGAPAVDQYFPDNGDEASEPSDEDCEAQAAMPMPATPAVTSGYAQTPAPAGYVPPQATVTATPAPTPAPVAQPAFVLPPMAPQVQPTFVAPPMTTTAPSYTPPQMAHVAPTPAAPQAAPAVNMSQATADANMEFLKQLGLGTN